MPKPEVLGRNGSYVVFRKLQTRVAAFRQYIRARAKSREEEELLAAKFVGRWPSGAPLVLAPERDEPELGADPGRNNAFLYAANDDARGLKCPLGAHARRTNPRDAKITGIARNHRIIRRSSSYGPILPEGVLEDDGADRGILFFCLQARLAQQFEFVKTQWINDGTFFGTPAEIDPFAGPNDGTDRFTIPQRPIRRRLTELPQFVVNASIWVWAARSRQAAAAPSVVAEQALLVDLLILCGEVLGRIADYERAAELAQGAAVDLPQQGLVAGDVDEPGLPRIRRSTRASA
jgi:deferrochelatase/peroxidase EfeB